MGSVYRGATGGRGSAGMESSDTRSGKYPQCWNSQQCMLHVARGEWRKQGRVVAERNAEVGDVSARMMRAPLSRDLSR